MATTTINTPAIIKIANTSTRRIGFVPYKENFTTYVDGGKAVELEVKHPGIALYYLKQATEGLAVTQIAEFEDEDNVIVINSPAKITIENTSDKRMLFVPYKENFVQEVKAGDSIVLTAQNPGVVLYYLAQATEGLAVTQEEVPNE